MKITFLGTGTSQGVPIIACDCSVCVSVNGKDKRLRSSILIESDTTTICIDSGPDFRQQMLRQNVQKLDALVFTHSHKDHIAGMDDIRAFNYILQKPIDVYATEYTQQKLHQEFEYIFNGTPYPGIPEIKMHTIDAQNKIQIRDICLTPIEVMHYKMPVLGFRVQNFTYITDANYIQDTELEKIKGTETFVLNALRHEQHISHFTVQEAIQVATKIQAKETYFTHLSHQIGLHDDIEKTLPQSMHLSYDGLILTI